MNRDTPVTRSYRSHISVYDSEKFATFCATPEAVGYFNGYRAALKAFTDICGEASHLIPLVPADYWFFVVYLPNFNTGTPTQKVVSGGQSSEALTVVFLHWMIAELRNAFQNNRSFTADEKRARELLDEATEAGFLAELQTPQPLLETVNKLLDELEAMGHAV